MPRRLSCGATLAAVALVLCSCQGGSGARDAAAPTTRGPANPSSSTTTVAATTSTTTTTPRPPTTATRPAPPPTTIAVPFSSSIGPVTASQLGPTYHPGCPVGPAALRLLHLGYFGFDGAPHIGTMVVNAAVANAVVDAFARLFHARFPIREMQPVADFGGSDDASMAADNTSGFNCRYVADTTKWSVHAYGEAIDVNTVENPYLVDGRVEPPSASAYLDRSDVRPGMAAPGTALNDAFAAIGWYWGGRFHSPDYQHFSKTGG